MTSSRLAVLVKVVVAVVSLRWEALLEVESKWGVTCLRCKA